MDDAPILDAKTIRQFMEALNRVFGWTLPVDFPEGSGLAAIWALPITVEKDPSPAVRYRATAAAPYSIIPQLEGVVYSEVPADEDDALLILA